ncbi:MAG: AAA family ATPase, partial [Synechococcaceae bacterium WB8_1A_041]|nr:AAA family ATPase [Synechococcaceae bacterium WB8_1A_041]
SRGLGDVYKRQPGTGKTSLARIIANSSRCYFSSLNAVLAGVRELREAVEQAQEKLGRHGLRTLLFIDEVHRFNKSQQDALLPWVENGTVTLIGATTENPFFEVNKALLSRSRLFRLEPLSRVHLELMLQRAIDDKENGYGSKSIQISADAREHLVAVAGGDARSLLNALELAVESSQTNSEGIIEINLSVAEQSIQQQAVLYDKQGDAHFDTISAFIKSIRGSDPDAALFWLARMVKAGEDSRFIFRRLLIAAAEDIGLADPQAMVVVEACASAFDRIGLPEGIYPLVQATLYLANTNKSNSTKAYFDAFNSLVKERAQEIPAHLRDPSRDGAALGDGENYLYPHNYSNNWVAQQYLPSALQGEMFYKPGIIGWEGERFKQQQQHRYAQLLQHRFWQRISLQPRHRVLICNCPSIHWALPVIMATNEGLVCLQVEDQLLAKKLETQLQLFDNLQKPSIQQVNPLQLEKLQTQGAGKFDHIITHNPLVNANPSDRHKWLKQLDLLVTQTGRIDLLFSYGKYGPFGLLPEEYLKSASSEANCATTNQSESEQKWLLLQDWGQVAKAELENSAWQVSEEYWQETILVSITSSWLERWFSNKSSYRQWWLANFSIDLFNELENYYRQRLGNQFVQPLQHHHLIGHKKTPPIGGVN